MKLETTTALARVYGTSNTVARAQLEIAGLKPARTIHSGSRTYTLWRPAEAHAALTKWRESLNAAREARETWKAGARTAASTEQQAPAQAEPLVEQQAAVSNSATASRDDIQALERNIGSVGSTTDRIERAVHELTDSVRVLMMAVSSLMTKPSLPAAPMPPLPVITPPHTGQPTPDMFQTTSGGVPIVDTASALAEALDATDD